MFQEKHTEKAAEEEDSDDDSCTEEELRGEYSALYSRLVRDV